jgi:hypothetical protein
MSLIVIEVVEFKDDYLLQPGTLITGTLTAQCFLYYTFVIPMQTSSVRLQVQSSATDLCQFLSWGRLPTTSK